MEYPFHFYVLLGALAIVFFNGKMFLWCHHEALGIRSELFALFLMVLQFLLAMLLIVSMCVFIILVGAIGFDLLGFRRGLS